MPITLNDNLKILAPKSSDNRYLKNGVVPYESVTEANTLILYKHAGLTVLIDDGGGPAEYWYVGGTFVPKSGASGGGAGQGNLFS
jgi:hypothetical protein